MTSKHWTLVGGAVACLTPVAVITSLGLFSLQAQAQSPQRDLAFPGYSGFLNVPSATVLNRGQAAVQWSDQAYINTRYHYEDGYHHLNNVSGTFGIFPNVELGGRLTWDKTHAGRFVEFGGIRDLSANVKIQAPFIPEEWFTLAAGAQDLGGETGDFEAFYLVAGRQLGPVEVALGYGKPEATPRYLDGAFGAVSYRPLPWLSIMAEHDSLDARLGIGATSPQGWLPYGLQVKGKVLAWDEGDTDNDRHFASLGLSMPFGNAPRKQRLQPVPAAPAEENANKAQNAPPQAGQVASTTETSTKSTREAGKQTARQIGEHLVNAGYDRVRTASDGDTLHIWWENNLYNRDERDSILDVARTAHNAVGSHQQAELTLLNQGLPVLSQTVALSEQQPYRIKGQFAETTLFNSQQPEWDFEGSYGPSWKPRLTLSPSISSGVATEYGVWDASVALSSELAFSLWPGALASARYDAEIYQTDDFDKGGVFYNSRQRTGLVEADIQQAFKLHPQLLTAFHAGRYALDYNGGFNETLLLSPGGRHAVGILAGRFSHTNNRGDDRTQALAQYSYYNPGLDAQFTVYGGQFFAEDEGIRLDSRFWFGDYALTLQYKNTDAEFVSLGWVIPLTPTKGRQFKYLQIKGDADFNYAVQTRINEDANTVSFGGAGIVNSSNPLREVYLNRGRAAQ
ncbi:YjbH domain-containing protein [Marinobacter changyiensis]|uniref:YjbH domain-containing protein n=1 Tax=Marinobacter changyiensis TaxID=2604091 RepID=UPI0012655296|nr:YjbH domain-containing protein [Marinobacter changyiensis]